MHSAPGDRLVGAPSAEGPRGARACARVLVAALLAVLSARCASLGLGADPQQVLEEARVSLEQDEYEKGYDRLARIRREHPESEAAEEAYRLATRVHRRLFYYYRFSEPDSRWLTTEPEFLFEWFASGVDPDAAEFPRQKARQLLHYFPWRYSRRFVAWAQAHPELSAWEIEVEEDNGRVVDVRAERRGAALREP